MTIQDTVTAYPTARLPILLSFHYYRTANLADLVARFPVRPRVFGDSGAWSAYTQQVDLSYEDYTAWCRRWSDVLEVYSNLDDLRDPKLTYRNQLRMEQDGLLPIPVVHMGEPLSWLTKYLEDGYRYIALGRMVGRGTPAVMRWLIQCFKLAEPYGAVFHGFGQTRFDAIASLPFYSVDSSSWGSGHTFGNLSLWDDTAGRFQRVAVGDPKTGKRWAHLTRAYGYDPLDFMDRERFHHSLASGLCGVSWVNAASWVRRRHGPIHRPPEVGAAAARRTSARPQSDTGADVYLADGTGDRLVNAALAVDRAHNTPDDGVHLYPADTSGDHLANVGKAVASRHTDEGLHLYLACSGGDPGRLADSQQQGPDQ